MPNNTLYHILRPIVKIFTNIFIRPKYQGLENIPESGPIILAGNHRNNLDSILVMSSTKRSVHFLAKVELWHGLKGILFSHMGLIPVDRSIHDHNALEEAYKYLNNDKVIGIFPEGTFSKANKLLPFKIGTVKMAKECNAMIVPFAITGKYKLCSKNLTITFEKPYKLSSDNLDEENNILYKKITKMIEGANNES